MAPVGTESLSRWVTTAARCCVAVRAVAVIALDDSWSRRPPSSKVLRRVAMASW